MGSSAACQVGLCIARGGACAVTSDADCAASDACRDHGLCHFDEGRCVAGEAGCASSLDCRKLGLCRPLDSKAGCTAKSEPDCRSAEICRDQGACVARGGQCVAVSATDCELSRECVARGMCRVDRGRCVR